MSVVPWKTALEAFLAHIDKRPDNAPWGWFPACRCHDDGPGTLRATEKDDGGRIHGEVCPVGGTLWSAVLEASAIPLSRLGEALRLYPGMTPARWDASALSTCIGVHLLCDGWMDTRQVAPAWNALCCRQCHGRWLIPAELKTIAELRTWMMTKGLTT